MYKILVALLISCVSGNVFAACPATLEGKYSGQGTYTELTNWIVDDVAEKLYVVSFDGKGTKTVRGKMISSLYIEVDSGISGVVIQTSSVTLPYTFDKTNCYAKIIDPIDGDINLVVANSGNTVYGVKREKSFKAVERYFLTKQ